MSMYGFRNYRRVNQLLINKALEKIDKGELTIEEILDEDEYVLDLKSSSYSQLSNWMTRDKLSRLIYYVTIEPCEDADKKLGYKFPYNACDILSSENLAIIEKFFEVEEEKENKISSEAGDDNENEFDNENQFKNKILQEKQNKEIKEIVNEETKVDDGTTHQIMHMEADINMQSNPEKLVIFEEIQSGTPNQEEKKEDNDKEEKENNEDNKEKSNVNAEEAQSDNNDDKNNQTNSNDNNIREKQHLICEENFFSQDNREVKEISHEVQEHKLIDELLQFVDTDKALNYVLSGYFSKIFLNLLNLKTNNLITYIFKYKKQFLKSLIYHSNMKSISDTILKILNTNLTEIEGGEDLKIELISNIMDNYLNNEYENSENICDLLFDLISNRNIYYICVKNEELFKKLYSLISKEKNKDMIRILTKLNESLLKDIAGTATSFTNNSENFFWMQFTNVLNIAHEEESKDNYLEIANFNYIFRILANSLKIVMDDFINQEQIYMSFTINSSSNPALGLKRIYHLEFIKSILEIILNAKSSINFNENNFLNLIIQELLDFNFFSRMTEYFFQYEWNNMYQKAYEAVILLTINKYTPESLIKLVYEELKLVDLFINKIFERNFSFESGRKIFNGNFAFICELSFAILRTDNPHLRKLIEQSMRFIKIDHEWNEFNDFFAKPIRDKFQNGIQFPKENCFEENNETKASTSENETSETMLEIFYRCKGNLPFMKKVEKQSTEDLDDELTSGNDSPMKNMDNYQNYEDLALQNTVEKQDHYEFYDNNYWNTKISDLDLEIL